MTRQMTPVSVGDPVAERTGTTALRDGAPEVA
jgi:hypothetical protein